MRPFNITISVDWMRVIRVYLNFFIAISIGYSVAALSCGHAQLGIYIYISCVICAGL